MQARLPGRKPQSITEVNSEAEDGAFGDEDVDGRETFCGETIDESRSMCFSSGVAKSGKATAGGRFSGLTDWGTAAPRQHHSCKDGTSSDLWSRPKENHLHPEKHSARHKKHDELLKVDVTYAVRGKTAKKGRTKRTLRRTARADGTPTLSPRLAAPPR